MTVISQRLRRMPCFLAQQLPPLILLFIYQCQHDSAEAEKTLPCPAPGTEEIQKRRGRQAPLQWPHKLEENYTLLHHKKGPEKNSVLARNAYDRIPTGYKTCPKQHLTCVCKRTFDQPASYGRSCSPPRRSHPCKLDFQVTQGIKNLLCILMSMTLKASSWNKQHNSSWADLTLHHLLQCRSSAISESSRGLCYLSCSKGSFALPPPPPIESLRLHRQLWREKATNKYWK